MVKANQPKKRLQKSTVKEKATTQIPEHENIANNDSHYNPADSSFDNFASPKLLKVTWGESSGR